MFSIMDFIERHRKRVIINNVIDCVDTLVDILIFQNTLLMISPTKR